MAERPNKGEAADSAVVEAGCISLFSLKEDLCRDGDWDNDVAICLESTQDAALGRGDGAKAWTDEDDD